MSASCIELLRKTARYGTWLLLAATCAVPVRAQERVYITTNEAIARGLRGASDIRERVVHLTPARAKLLEKETGADLLDSTFVFHQALSGDGVERSMVILDVIGQYQPITMYVAMSAAGSVERVEIMAYRESRGGEVRRGAFLRQFEEKTVADALNPGGDIMNITGATISSRAVSRGVRLALRLRELIPDDDGQ